MVSLSNHEPGQRLVLTRSGRAVYRSVTRKGSSAPDIARPTAND